MLRYVNNNEAVIYGDVNPETYQPANFDYTPPDNKGEGGQLEIDATDVKLICGSEDYPITPKEHGPHFLMEHRHLWLRSLKQKAILRVRHRIIKSIRDFFDNHGFTLVDAPIFTPNACEGSTTLFETDYFDQKAYLSQSGQLYMEAACAAVGKAYFQTSWKTGKYEHQV